MAAIFCDSFDHYTTAFLNQKWNSGNAFIDTSLARTGPNSLACPAAAIQHLTIDDALGKTMICGTAVQANIFGGSIMGFSVGASAVLWTYVGIDNAGVLFWTRFGGPITLLAPAASALHTGVWYRVEMKMYLVNDLTGTIEIRLNGIPVIVATGINTAGQSGVFDTWGLTGAGGGAQTNHDDVYLCDSTGSVNNDFLGDVIVVEQTPDADGAYAEWTPLTGSDHYAMVNEIPPDSDTSYVSSDTVGQRDTYKFPAPSPLPSPLTVPFRQALYYAEKDAAGDRLMAPLLRQGGVDFLSANDQAPSLNAYFFGREVFDLNPVTASAWIEADLTACELGQQITG